MIDPVTTAYLAAGTVAGATLAPAFLLMWLQRAIDMTLRGRRARMAAVIRAVLK